MRTIIAPLGVVLMAGLALTGCGGGSQAGGGAATTQAPIAPTSASPTPTPTPTPKSYSNEDLATLVSGLRDANGKPFTVVPAAQIDQGILAAKELLKTAVVKPETCNIFASSNTSVPEGSTYAAGASQDAGTKTATVVTVIALKDTQAMSEQLAKSKDTVAKCAKFTLEAKGQKISAEVKPLDVKTEGETSFGAMTKQVLPTGQQQTSLTVTAVKGDLGVSAVKTGADVAPAATAELTKLVNAALAKG